ncbi:MAG TPA: ribonuclease P protein component [Terriglobales bacterium]|nr:ribonuclease P protein component [Terriglobales bacterium]
MAQEGTTISQQFPRSSRLLRHADFQAVYRQGKKRVSGNVVAFFLERADEAGPRIGFTVGKLLGGAVERNRIRRRMRAAVRHSLANFHRSMDVVLHPRKSVSDMEFAALENEIGNLFVALETARGRA